MACPFSECVSDITKIPVVIVTYIISPYLIPITVELQYNSYKHFGRTPVPKYFIYPVKSFYNTHSNQSVEERRKSEFKWFSDCFIRLNCD